MRYEIVERSRHGEERKLFPVGDSPNTLENAVGYLCALTVAAVDRRTVRHSLTHWSFATKSFTCSGLNGSMLTLSMKEDKR